MAQKCFTEIQFPVWNGRFCACRTENLAIPFCFLSYTEVVCHCSSVYYLIKTTKLLWHLRICRYIRQYYHQKLSLQWKLTLRNEGKPVCRLPVVCVCVCVLVTINLPSKIIIDSILQHSVISIGPINNEIHEQRGFGLRHLLITYPNKLVSIEVI